jgi:hypothetical protein
LTIINTNNRAKETLLALSESGKRRKKKKK